MDETIHVFRVEREDGVGPYSDYRPELDITSTLYHPTPSSDGIYLCFNDYCGFKTIDQMKSWFSENELAVLSRFGFTCNVYSTPIKSVKFGSKQLVFERARATLVEKMNLEDTFEYAV